jgi:hypothetical protein
MAVPALPVSRTT